MQFLWKQQAANTVRARIVLATSIGVTLAVVSMLAGAVSNCKMIQIADWPVRFERNKLIVDGTINGQKIGVMLDTGAEKSLILRAAAMRLGMDLHEAHGYRMIGIGGETRAEVASINEFKIGQATRHGWNVLVSGEHDFGGSSDFVLGEDFLHMTDVEFDLAHNAVRLYQPKDCERASLAYWATDGAGETEIDAVDDARPQIILTVQINGQPVRARLDSGAGASVLTKAEAARLGVTSDTPGVVAVARTVGLGSKWVDTWIGPFESFAIGNEVVRNVTIYFADLWKDATYTATDSRIPKHLLGEEPMLLGADFLRAHRLLIAHSQRKLYFTYTGGPVFQPWSVAPAKAIEATPPAPQAVDATETQ